MTGLLTGIPGPLALIAVFVLLFAESGLLIGVFLPGAGAVLALGWLAGHGVVEVWAAVASVFAATALGCQHGFFRGRQDGMLRRVMLKRLGERRLMRVESALDGRAEVAVATSQCFAAVRTLVPRLAARSGMTHLRFTICNVPVAAFWATTLVLLGAWSGEAYEQVQTVVGFFGIPLLAIAVLLALVIWWFRRKGTPREGHPCAEHPAEGAAHPVSNAPRE